MGQEQIKSIMEKVEHYGSKKVVELTLSRNDYLEDADKAEDEANVLLNEIEQDIKSTLSEMATENTELKKLASMASIFVDDVMPQISKLCIQDFSNLNELCMALSASKRF